MNIITISREFGSGGRELGKRLADLLTYDYYDREIITAIAAKKGMSENYVDRTLDAHSYRSTPLNFGRSFSVSAKPDVSVELLLEQKKCIEEIALAKRNCVIVGRNADVILQEYHPLNLFVCAQKDAKIHRCTERADKDEKLSSREIAHQMKRIDLSRRELRRIITNSEWGNPDSYHLVVNTTDWDIKELAPTIANFAEHFFRRENKYEYSTF